LTGDVSPHTQALFDHLESLPEGAAIIVSFDCEASSWPEIGPIAEALARHAFRRNLKVVGTSFLSEGASLGYELLRRTADSAGRTYGTDWVYLGFRPQYVAAILGMGESFGSVYSEDFIGQNIQDYALMQSVRAYRDVSLVVSIADDSMPQYWIDYAGTRYNLPIAAGLSAVMVTTFTPFLDSGQLTGLVGGLKGAAEYEKLLGISGAGTRGMDAQSSAHLAIILLVIVGNVAFFASRRKP
jgi:hypothetical protein